MQSFQTTIVTRGKQIEIRANIGTSEYEHAQFLRNYQQCRIGFLQQIYEKLQYSGDQMLVSIVFFLSFATSQTYNLFTYSSNVAYEISITACLLYSLLFMSILNFKREILIQFLCLILSGGFLVLSILTTVIDTYTAAGIIFSVFLCLFAKIVIYVLENQYADEATPKFAFQSNLLLFNLIAWKIYQISLDYAGVATFHFDSLVSTLIAVSVVNSIKVYTLFDFEVFQVIKVFKQKYEKSQNEDSKNVAPLLQSVSIYIKSNIKSDQEESHQGQTQKPLQRSQMNEDKVIVPDQSIQKMFQKSGVLEEQSHTDRVIEKDQKSFQSNLRMVAFLIFATANLAFLVYIIVNKQSATTSFKSDLLWYSVSFLRTTLLLISCEYQKVLRGQIKDTLNYILVFVNDLFWILSSVLMMLLPALISLQNEESFMLSMIPLATIKIFNYLDKSVHQKLQNGLYLSIVLFWFIPLSFREIGYTLNSTVVTYILDIVSVSYAIFVLLIWSNKDSFISFIRQVKKVLVSKKDRLKVFQKLKTTKFQYSQIIQLYIYLHVIYLNLVYYTLSNISDLMKIMYLIIYFSPLLLYLLALINCHSYSSCIPQTYKPSLSNFLIFLGSIVYIIVAYKDVLSSDHQTWSLIVFLNVFLFILALEGEKLAIIYFPAYCNFLRVMVITVLFFFIYFPFIVGFISGYFITNFSESFQFYYSLVGFFFIWLVITLVGMAIHWILNLTEKSKKELFIARYMQGEMKKINLKEDIEKILMISNMFEVFNYKSEELLKYLKSQQHMAIVTRKQKEYEYDYELVEPEQKQKKRLSIVAKPLNVFDIAKMVSPASFNKMPSEIQESKQNPVLLFFKEKEKNKIEIVSHQDNNANITQLRRMIARKHQIPTNQKENEKTQQYKAMVSASNEVIAQNMSKLYTFLTKPGKLVSSQTFSAFLTLLTRENQTIEAANKVYNKFSPNGLMDEYKFKNFILDYVNFKYQMTQDTLCARLRTYCCKEIVPLLLTNFEQFRHSIIRKKANLTPQSLQVWLQDKVSEEDNSQFNLIKQRQLKKKAKLLKKTLKKKKASNKEDEAEQEGENNEEVQEIIHKRNPTLLKVDKRELKDKKFMKSQNVYAVLVNSLIECNLYYQKEAENFKIKTIKFTISNLLAIVTKIVDIVFVFGYSTIYLFIAYYNNIFDDNYPFYSSVSYYILLIASVTLVLIYILLIVYHKSDFQKGTLGLDENQRSLDFKNIKFYTTTVLFLLGSSLANYILSIGLNSYICNSTTLTLYNFSDQSCYDTFQYGFMLCSLLILVVYWPLSAITFPFSTAMNRDLQIKYKAQYQILYLQSKFLINGFNTLLNPYPYQTEQLINSISKVVICSILALLYNQMQPCSYELLNRIEGKIYIILALLSFSGALCYFVGLFYSIIITGSILGLYLVYFIYTTIKNYTQLKNDNEQNEIIEDNIKNQKLKIEIIKQTNQQQLKNEQMTMQSLKSKNKNIFGFTDKTIEKYRSGNISQSKAGSQSIGASQNRSSFKTGKESVKRVGFF